VDPDIIIPLAGMVTGVVIVGTLGMTVRHWITRHYGRMALDDPARERIGQLEDRVLQLEDAAARMQDLEERLDFTERVLAQERGRPRLGAEQVERRT
jgi:hypothetical protein